MAATPTRIIAGGSARAVNGQAAATAPTSVMNRRRLMLIPKG
jgi:hypothetical protein